MDTKIIGREAAEEIDRLKQIVGVKFEFGVAQHPYEIFDLVQPYPKVTVWYNLSPKDIFYVYRGLCEAKELGFNENLEGQYLYIKVLN